MRTEKKIYLGILTIIPLVFWVASWFLDDKSGNKPSYYGVIAILVYLLTLAMIIFYIVNIFKNEHVTQAKKLTWVILIFLFGLILMPIYWYKYIWSLLPYENLEQASTDAPQINESKTADSTDILFKSDDQKYS